MRNNRRAFTLIELLMVIAIIGVLAGILIPTIGAVRKQAKIASSKSQLAGYVNAMQLFKGEYGYYPLVSGAGESDEIDLSSDSAVFIRTLSARDPETGLSTAGEGNRKRISFLTFSDSDSMLDDSDNIDRDQLADRFNNPNLFIVVDTDGNGFVQPNGPGTGEGKVRTSVTAYANDNSSSDYESYKLWD